MFSFDVVFFGKVSSGKTKLVEQIKRRGSADFSYYQPTVAATYNNRIYGTIPILDQPILLFVRDASSDSQYGSTISRSIQVGFYCVDLAEPLDRAAIQADVDMFRKNTNGAPLILVGTKADQITDQAAALQQLEELSKKMGFAKYFVTSARTQQGVSNVKDAMFASINDHVSSLNVSPFIEKVNGNKSFYDALIKFQEVSEKLSPKKYNAICLETIRLITRLSGPHHTDKKKAIEIFKENCLDHINGLNFTTNKIILSVYATIIVAALAAVTGFFIGLLAGLWTGPGAFASAIAAGYLAANLVLAGSGALGIFTGILSHYMLSQDTPAVVALEQVNKLATTWEEKNALQQEFSHGVKCSMFGYMHTKEYYLEKKNKDKNNSKSLKLAKECLTQLEEGSTINELLSKTTLPQKGSFFSLMEEVKKENQYISLCEHKMNIDYHSIKLIS